jgi:tetratricopeptide (TPR) repeat protein
MYRVDIKDFDGAITDLGAAIKLFDEEILGATSYERLSYLRSEQLHAYYWRGVALYSKGHFEVSIGDFSLVIGSSQTDYAAAAYAMRAFAYEDLDRHQEAIEDWTALLKFEPTAQNYRNRASCYKSLGEDWLALADLDKVIELDPTARDYITRGWTYHLVDIEDLALRDFDIAIGLGARTAHLYQGRGHAQRDSGNLTAALENYNEAIRLDPNDPYGYSSRAYVRFDLGEYKTALADAQKSLSISPTNPNTYMLCGNCHHKLGDSEAARRDFLKAADLYSAQNAPEKSHEAFARALGFQRMWKS